MINPEQIPDEVWVGATIRLEALGTPVSGHNARAAIAAALAAWPGMDIMPFGDGRPRIRLPLTEARDDR